MPREMQDILFILQETRHATSTRIKSYEKDDKDLPYLNIISATLALEVMREPSLRLSLGE